MRNIRQNLFFAFVYNAAGVPIAAGVLYPVFGILLSPIIARRRDGAVVGQRDRQCAAVAGDRSYDFSAVNRAPPSSPDCTSSTKRT